MSAIINDLCDAVVARLQAAPELSGVTILNQASVSLVNDIEHALAGVGLVIVVAVESARMSAEGRDTTYSCVALVTEKLRQNRSGSGRQLAASEAAEYVQATLSDWAPGEIWATITSASIVAEPSGEEELQWAVEFSTRAKLYPGS